MDSKGKIGVQTIIVIVLVIAIVGLVMGWIPNPFARDGSGITVYLLDENLDIMETVSPDKIYNMPIGPFGIIEYGGKTVGGFGFALWVKPTAEGTSSGIVTIKWTGWRYVGSTGGSYCSGTKNVDWGKETELVWDKYTDAWIQVTSSTLDIWGLAEGSHTLKVYYDVTATGAVDGVPKTATAKPEVSLNFTWKKGTLSLVAGIKTSTLAITK